MNQDEYKENIKETFNVSFEDQEILPAKNNNKVKIIITIISIILILAVATTLLIGYFKFNWFKSEVYKVDTNIKREVNQASYFTENKKINTKIELTKDTYEEQNIEIDTNFMVYIKDRIKINENDYLNKAYLIILNSTMTSKDEKYNLPSFNISDENQIKDFKSNPNGSKYPIVFFSFYENGTITIIKFPPSTNEYNTQTLKELLEKVIPKLSRNRTEDYNNGLNIKIINDGKKKILIEEELPKNYLSFKGSNFSKTVERDFENDTLTNITTKTDIHLQSNKEEGEQILGANDFHFYTESKINTYKLGFDTPAAKECNWPFDGEEDLIEDEENENFSKNNKTDNIRKLDEYNDISAEQTFNIGKYNLLGQNIAIKYHVAILNGNPINEIIIDSDLGKTIIGNTGTSFKGIWNESFNLFTFNFPTFPLISLSSKVKGLISWDVKDISLNSSIKLDASLDGKISLGCEIKAGCDNIASLSAGVECTIVDASGSAIIQNKSVTKNFNISTGKLYAYLDEAISGKKERLAEETLFNGW